MNSSILTIENLNVYFDVFGGSVSAVRGLNLTLDHNESIGIIGESGCGKSTLSYTIMRYLAPNSRVTGKVMFREDNLLEKTEQEILAFRGNRIAMVYQNPYSSLNPALTIGFQLDEVTRFHQKASKEKAREKSIQALTSLNMGDPEGLVKRYPHQISGGMQQRVCIAMALLCQPDLMILDEPTTALDVTTEAVILDLIRDLKDKYAMSLMYISHDIGVINKVADRIVVMYSGEIVESGPNEELFAHPHHPYTRALINCIPREGLVKENFRLNTIPGYVKQRGTDEGGCPFAERCSMKVAGCIERYGMREVGEKHAAACDRAYAADVADSFAKLKVSRSKQHADHTKPILEVQDLYKHFGKKRKIYAVNGVSVGVERGTVLGIVGESGCGKTTMGQTAVGLYTPSKGRILFNDTDISVSWKKRSPEMLKQIQFIFQNPGRSLNPSHTVEQIISRPLKKLMGISSREERKTRIIKMLEQVGLSEEYLSKKSSHLSGGEQQRVAIARAFCLSPGLIICDEPTSALDVSVQSSVLNLLGDLQAETLAAYVFISHDLHVINYISDYIMVMYLGRVCEYGTREEVMQPPFHPYTEALLSSVPEIDPSQKKRKIRLGGQLPDPAKKIRGCPFAGRCHMQIGTICETQPPPLVKFSDTHSLSCHLDFPDAVREPAGEATG